MISSGVIAFYGFVVRVDDGCEEYLSSVHDSAVSVGGGVFGLEAFAASDEGVCMGDCQLFMWRSFSGSKLRAHWWVRTRYLVVPLCVSDDASGAGSC